MLNIGHVVTCNDIPLSYIYKICKYKISREIKHYLIVDKPCGYVNYFRQANIACLILKDEILFKNALKKMNIINFHWDSYDNRLHNLALEIKTPFLVTLYGSEKLPRSIPIAVCPFNYIRQIQSYQDRFVVIHEGIDLELFARISKHRMNLTRKRWTLVAPDSATQCNDKFWITIGGVLLNHPDIELKIIAPGWKSVGRTKAINDKRAIYRHIAQAHLAIYTPTAPTMLKIQESFCFVMIAMAMGIPCVVSKNKITDALIKHKINGIFVSTDKPAYFVKSIINVLEDSKLRKRCVLNAKQLVQDRFDIMVNVKKYESLLNTIAGTNSAGLGHSASFSGALTE
jgi:hypothetical protein